MTEKVPGIAMVRADEMSGSPGLTTIRRRTRGVVAKVLRRSAKNGDLSPGDRLDVIVKRKKKERSKEERKKE